MDILLITVLVVVGGFGLHGYIRGMDHLLSKEKEI